MALSRRNLLLALAVIAVVSTSAIVFAMRRTSTTFDEIVMIAGGARGFQTGEWDLAPEHPPFTQYIYGLLPYLAGQQYPDDRAVPASVKAGMAYRYDYAQRFFWAQGNDPERLAFLGRLPAALCALLLVLAAFFFIRPHHGDTAGLFAAAMVAFLPDVLAHGGVAYNDAPIALAFFVALWLMDDAVRRPLPRRALLAGVAIGVALGTKNSAIGLGPLAFVLLISEASMRRGEQEWWLRIVPAALLTVVTGYLTLVLIYRGDFQLREYQYALSFVFRQVAGSSAPAYLLGHTSTQGIWYYFPVAFFYKTSAGLHVLLALAVLFAATRVRSLRQVFASPLRAPLLGALIFALMLARSQLHIGFRYALPLIVLLTILVAPIAARIWTSNWQRMRPVVAAALFLLIAHPLSYYPNFLTYVSEYGPGRRYNYQVVVDSSLDWGQGLLQLRDFMRQQNIDRVYLSYFGSAWPAGYGIDYVPLPSFFNLPRTDVRQAPHYAAISATNLAGVYFGGRDPFRRFRANPPDHVIGNTIFLYRIQ